MVRDYRNKISSVTKCSSVDARYYELLRAMKVVTHNKSFQKLLAIHNFFRMLGWYLQIQGGLHKKRSLSERLRLVTSNYLPRI